MRLMIIGDYNLKIAQNILSFTHLKYRTNANTTQISVLPMYSQVKLLTIQAFHSSKGTFSFSIIHTATKLHIAIIAMNDTTGLKRISPITGSLNFIQRLRSLS